MTGNQVVINVREQGTAQTQSALKGLGVAGVAVGAAIGTAMTAMAYKAGGAFVDLAKSSVTAASNMQESLSKVRVVFGDSAAGIESFAKDAAKNMGLSNQAALEMSGTFGNLFTSMGITRPAAADMSKSILQLGADLGSFNNIPVAEALEKIRSGLVGEAEPLRSLGVNLNVAAVEAEAMRLGLMKTGETLTASGKAQATYSLILAQTANAQGDFARTSEGLANQQKSLTANFEDLKAKIGASLLPVVTDLTAKMSDLIAVNGDEWARQFATGVDELVGALTKAVRVGGDFNRIMSEKPEGGTSAWDLLNPFAAGNPVNRLADWIREGAGHPNSGILFPELGQQSQGRPAGGWGVINEEAAAAFGHAALGGVGGGAATSIAKVGGSNPLVSAWENLNETLHKELIDAWVKGGQGRMEAVQAEQAKLTATVTETAQRMSAALGIPLAEAILPAFASIRDAEEEMAKARVKAATDSFEAIEKVMRAEEELANKRRQDAFDLTKAAFSAGLGANTVGNNGQPFFGAGGLVQAPTNGVTNPDGSVTYSATGANYGTINNVYPNVTNGGTPVPSTADSFSE